MGASNSLLNVECMFQCEQWYLNVVLFPEAQRRMAQEPVLRLLLAERRASSWYWRLTRRIQSRVDSGKRALLHGLADLLTLSAERLREWAASRPTPQP